MRCSDLAKQATLIISNEEMSDIMKIVKSLEESSLLIKEVSELIKNEAKEQKGGLFSILIGTLGASLLGSLLLGKGIIRSKIDGQWVMKVGEGTIRADQEL